MNGTSRPLSVRSRLLSLAVFAGGLLAVRATPAGELTAPSRPDTLPEGAVPAPERSGANHETWDLGPVEGEPGKHRFAVAIHGAPRPVVVTLPATGAAPAVWTLPDGRRVSWEFDPRGRMPLRELPAPAGGAETAVAEFAPAPGTGELRREGEALRFQLRPAGAELRTRLTLDAGLVAELPRDAQTGLAGALQIRDERLQTTLLVIEFSAAVTARLDAARGGLYELTLAGAPAPAELSGGGHVVAGVVTPVGTWGGYQCYRGATAGTAFNQNPYSFVFVGEYSHASSNPYTCDGYIRWDVYSAIPTTSTVYATYIWPISTNSKTGTAAMNVHVTDVSPGNALPYSTGSIFSTTYYNDFNSMYGGHSDYAAFSVNLSDATTAYNLALGAQATQDLNNRLRSGTYFAVGLYADALAANNYATFRTDTSTFWAYYTDYVHSQVAISYVGVRNDQERYEIDLYNYGEAISLTGWKIGIKNYAGFGGTITLPAFTLARHSRVRLLTGAGTDTADTLHIGILGALDNVSSYVGLQRPDNSYVDFVCTGSTVTLPATPGWNGACVGSPAAPYQYDLARSRDSDTNSAADWLVTPNTSFVPNPPLLQPGMGGVRRRSDVFINELYVWPGYNWIEIANYGPDINLQGWTLNLTSANGTGATYTFPSTPLYAGEVLWMAEGVGTTFCPACSFGLADRLHVNLGFNSDWDVAPYGGYAVLKDQNGRGRDMAVFGSPNVVTYPADFNWTGAYIPVNTSTLDLRRDSDLTSNGGKEWVSAGTSTGNFGLRSPSQHLPATRNWDENGSAATVDGYYDWYGGGGAFGIGAVINVTQQVGLEEFMIQGAPVVGPTNALLVVKKQGAGSIYYSKAVVVSDIGQTYVRTGTIAPPLVLDPGDYAVMLYLNGDWFAAETFNRNELLSFGATPGLTYESGFTPTPAFATNLGGWSLHAYYSTVPPPLITSAAVLQPGTVGVAYPAFTHTATGGYGAYSWSLAAGSSPLPAGLALSAGGVLNGTPTTAGYYRFTVQVTDVAGLARTQQETLVVNPALQVGTSSMPDADTHSAYSAQLVAFGGKPAYAWSVVAGALPSGLTLSGTGLVSGTPTAADGTYGFTVRVIDANVSSATKALTIKVQNSALILSGSLPGGNPGVYYAACLTGLGGTGSASWTLIGGSLPPGLALGSLSGCVSGTPTTNGTYSGINIRYAAGAQSTTKLFSITISDPAVPPYWIRRGLTGGNLTQLFFSPNYAQDGTVVGTNGTVMYASITRGRFWKPMKLRLTARRSGNSALPDRFTSVAFAPDFDGRPVSDPSRPPAASFRLIVTSDHTGVWYSDDFDGSWTAMAAGLSAEDGAFAFGADAAFSPAFNSDNTVYIRSFEPALKSHLLYRGVVNTVAKTAVWSPVNLNQPDFRGGLQFSQTFAADQTIYGLDAANHLYRTTDAGGHWVVSHDFSGTPLWPDSHPALSPKHAADGTLAVTDNSGRVLISDDRGVTFNYRGGGNYMGSVRIPPDYDPATHPYIYAGYSALYVSRDGGLSYTPTGQGGVGPNDLNLYAGFEISPDFANDATIIGQGALEVGLYRSEDGGADWGPSDGGLYIQEIKTLVYAKQYSISGRAYLGTVHSAYFTANHGRTWVHSNLVNVDVRALRVNPQDDTNVFAFVCDNPDECYIAESTDGGRTYNYVSNGGNPLNDYISRPHAFQISPNFSGDQILAYANDVPDFYNQRLMASGDAGQTFVEREPDPVGDETGFYQSFALSPAFATDSFACFNSQYGPYQQTACDDGFSASPSGYMSLFSMPAPLGNSAPVFAPQFNYLTGVNGQLSHTFFMNCGKTTNAGATFSSIPSSGAGCSPYGELAIAPDYAASQTLFSQVSQPDANNPVVGLFRSTDGGGSFSRLSAQNNLGLYAGEFDVINQIGVSPFYANDHEAMVATNAGLYISTDSGNTWTLASGVDPVTPLITAVATDPNRKNAIFIGNGYGEVFRSIDDGLTALPIQGNLACLPVNALQAVDGGSSTTILLAGCPNGIWRTTFNAAGTWVGSWTNPQGGSIRTFSTSAGLVYAARTNGASLYSTTGLATSGVTWTAMGAAVGDASAISFNSQSGPTTLAPKDLPKMPTVNTAPLWSASGNTGAFYSNNGGANWIAAPGGGDYALPVTSGWSAVQSLGINAGSGSREVLIGHTANGVYLTRDGGATWKNVSGPGSGLEATSKYVSTLLSTTTPSNTLDVLIGINGTSNGGVYLSGDGGEHWAQVNQGFDPSSLNISTLAKTSCGGCPVQYYSGTYGSGMYTRTIPVLLAPAFPSANASCYGATNCTCSNAGGSGPEQGGQAFKLCGANFQALAVVEFDGVPATGCNTASATTITCTGTPPHVPGTAAIRVRNPDTRAGFLATNYTYTGGVPRVTNLTVGKSGSNAILNWSCASCGAPPAKVYRSQNVLFTLNVESYTGGVGTYTNTGALAPGSNPSYFWNVE